MTTAPQTNELDFVACLLRNAVAGPDRRQDHAPDGPEYANLCELISLRIARVLRSERQWTVGPQSPTPALKPFYVVRVNGYALATYAAPTLEEAVDIAFPDDSARLEVGQVQAPDAGAARLTPPPLGWAGPFSVAELENRIRQNAAVAS